MAVYYKFKSAKDYDSIAIDSHFITVANLKERIFETKHLSRGTDSDLEVTNAQTSEEYPDDAMLIPKNTSVLIRRVPARSRMRMVTQAHVSKIENKPNNTLSGKSNYISADVSSVKDIDPMEWDDDFGNELYAPTPEVTPGQAYNAIQDDPPCQADEDSKIRALIETPALDWQQQAAEGFGPGRGFGRGGRMMGGRGFGRGGLERSTPPPGYVCHRCKVAGHYIQHCPTNGDPAYDVKRVKPPTGIPKSMLAMNPDGSYALPSGASVEMKPNEAAFEREIEGLPSTRPVGDLPPELHCPLCKQVMRDAVLTSKCCFESFCDKCIRDFVISKSACVCGATDVLADDLLPNKTVRDTINRILESANSSGDNAGSALQVQDMESARCQPKTASPAQSAASKGEHLPPGSINVTPKTRESVDEERSAGPPEPLVQQKLDKSKTAKVPDCSETTRESASAREPASQGSALPVDEEVQQKVAAAAEITKKKKKKIRPAVNAVDMQWRAPQDFGADSFMMPMAPNTYNPYWNGMQPGFQPGFQPGMEGYMGPFGVGMPYNMGYGFGPMDVPFPGVMPHDPFMSQNPMFPMVPPQRDLAEYSMGFNARPSLLTREQFEARKADLRRKREMERFGGGDMPKDRDHGRDVSSGANSLSVKSKPKPIPSHKEPSEERYDRERGRPRDNHYDRHTSSRGGSSGYQTERHSPARFRGDADRLSSKRKPEHLHQPPSEDRRHHHPRPEPKPSSEKSSSAADNVHKTSVFARISFRDGGAEPSKKRKPSPEPKALTKEVAAPPLYAQNDADYESSDEDRHFKRKPSRYRPSPPQMQDEARRPTRDREHSSRHR